MSAPLAQEFLSTDTRAPVLYLRPFEIDGSTKNVTREQLIAYSLRCLGPVVTIGRPDENLPGSEYIVREYFLDNDWRRGVLDLMDRAALLIVHVGVSKGLAWEIEQAILWGHPERIIIYFGFGMPRVSIDRRPNIDSIYHRQFLRFEKPCTVEQRYHQFLMNFNHLFPKKLPLEFHGCKFIAFSSGWTPILSDKFSTLDQNHHPLASHLQTLHKALVLRRNF